MAKLPYRPCVGIVVLNRDRKVWMGHRAPSFRDQVSRQISEKRWQLPQGGIDKGEKPLAAAKRELWEETGITSATLLAEAPNWIKYDLPDELIGKALKGKWRGQSQRWFAFLFEGKDAEINISHPPEGAPVEFDNWRWADLADIPDLIVPFKRQTYEQVVEAFKHLV
ncbi:MAG: RNA pyrophosphohydrolase [Rhizobiaceae bacterium]